jgi:hypothetical protein
LTKKLVALNEETWEAVKRAVAEVVNTVHNSRLRPDFSDETALAPETYVAWSEGIPALSESEGTGTGSGTGSASPSGANRPGQAICSIYQIIPDILTGKYVLQQVTTLQVQVFNVATTSIPRGWFVTTRDKFGRYLGLPPGASSRVYLMQAVGVIPTAVGDTQVPYNYVNNPGYPITAAAWAAGVATITTSVPHGMQVGQRGAVANK